VGAGSATFSSSGRFKVQLRLQRDIGP
jgi:hypothetical protein